MNKDLHYVGFVYIAIVLFVIVLEKYKLSFSLGFENSNKVQRVLKAAAFVVSLLVQLDRNLTQLAHDSVIGLTYVTASSTI